MKLAATFAAMLTGALALTLSDVDALYSVAENDHFSVETGNLSRASCTFDVQLTGINLYDYVGLVGNQIISPGANFTFNGEENFTFGDSVEWVERSSSLAIACVSATAALGSATVAWTPFATTVARQTSLTGVCSENMQYFNLDDDIVAYQYKAGCKCFNDRYYLKWGHLIETAINSKYHGKIPKAACLVESDNQGLIVNMAFGYSGDAVAALNCQQGIAAGTCSFIY